MPTLCHVFTAIYRALLTRGFWNHLRPRGGPAVSGLCVAKGVISMRVRCSAHRLRLGVGLLAAGVGAALVLPATGAVAAQHGATAVTSQTPLPVRNGTATSLGSYNTAQTIRLAIGLRP